VDASKSASATVTVTPISPPVMVEIAPLTASLLPGGTQQFSATVTGSGNTAVTWSIQEGGGGTVDGSGLYTAPAVAGVYHVVATSVADANQSAIATITVTEATTRYYEIPAARRTVWNPGIPGGIPTRTTLCATVTPAYAASNGLTAFNLDGTGNAAPAIQHAMNNCPAGQVVYLPPGTYRLNSALSLSRGITLRGEGATQTKLRLFNSNAPVIRLWPGGWPTYSAGAVNLTADAPKGSKTLQVASASGFAIGDIIQIDQDDDTSYLYYGGVPYFKRPDYGPPTPGGRPRSMGQTVEITAIDGNVLTIDPQIHLGFTLAHQPQVFKPDRTLKFAGLENLYVTGGTNGMIEIMSAAYSWVKGVESDGTVSANPAPDGTLGQGNGMTGAHLPIHRSFRIVVRDSYFHHATRVVQGGGAYGVSLTMHTSDSLIENNIIYYLNKPVTLRASGGGNVIAYNYVDDAWTSADRTLQETTIDLGHASFPYMELAEGNYTAQIATENVWGNSGWMTIFRNYASGKQARTNANERYQIAAIALEVKARQMNVVGNVLGIAERLGNNTGTNGDQAYEVTSNPPGPFKAAVFRIGHGVGAGNGRDDINTYESPSLATSTYANLLRVGNWDNIRARIDTAPSDPLPPSLYLTAKPAFFGTNPWPWVDPSGTTRVHVLPAKQRFDSENPVP
jgi:Pectate lyase superfamily protein/Bacterial Ig-like domain (group 2)